MKKLGIFTFVLLLMVGCTKDFEELRQNPNDAEESQPGYLLTYAQKNTMDMLRDEWAGGRMLALAPQYWGQRNYTDEDRYAYRSSVTDAFWRAMYLSAMNLDEIIRLNEVDAEKYLTYGNTDNQIAVAMILKAYIFGILTDIYGPVPYSEAFLGDANRTPKFDDQQSIYTDLLASLESALSMIKLAEPGFSPGDIIFEGDMTQWVKFGNSLRLRLALRMSGVDNGPLTSLLAANPDFIVDVADNAAFHYLTSSPNTHQIYEAHFIENRNDFTLAKPFVNLLKGVDDDLNGKVNPFNGIVDPRLAIVAHQVNGEYTGMPYGMADAETKAYSVNCPDFTANPSFYQAADYAAVLMSAAEVNFSLSEANGWDQDYYEAGIRASMLEFGVAPADINSYIATVPAATQETVLTQKYLALYSQHEQGWMEYRRTGFPTFLVKPGEITHNNGTDDVLFEVLEGNGVDLPSRMLYPVEEVNINGVQYDAAVELLGGADVLDTKVWWDVN